MIIGLTTILGGANRKRKVHFISRFQERSFLSFGVALMAFLFLFFSISLSETNCSTEEQIFAHFRTFLPVRRHNTFSQTAPPMFEDSKMPSIAFSSS